MIAESLTSLEFEFVCVHYIEGFCDVPQTLAVPLVCDLQNVQVMIVGDVNPILARLDRNNAHTELALRMLFKRFEPPTNVEDFVQQRIQEYRVERMKKFAMPGAFLVVRACGEAAAHRPIDTSRDLGGAIVGIDVVDKAAVYLQYDAYVANVLTATAISLGRCGPYMPCVVKGITFTLPDRRLLCAMQVSGGTSRVTESRPPTRQDAETIGNYATKLSASRNWRTPSRLIADAIRRSGDRLEAFLLAWAAIEMIIAKATSGFESGAWTSLLPDSAQESAREFHGAWKLRQWKTYSFSDKLRAVGICYQSDNWEETLRAIVSMKTSVREPLYHQGQLDDSLLPVENAIQLARTLMKVILDDVANINRAV